VNLSLILVSRNDQWESIGDNTPLYRLTRTLQWTLPKLTSQEEIVLVDWGSEVKLADALPPEVVADPRLRIFYVAAARAAACGSSFSEPHALNYAARVARGKWLARIDQDTLPGDRFFRWLPEARSGGFYFSNRRDMAEGQRSPSEKAVYGNEPTDYPPSGEGFWRWSVGVLMVERELWHRIRGYDERNIGRNHMEHEFIGRLNRSAQLVNLGMILGCPFWHQSHPRSGHASRPQNRLLNYSQLQALPEVANSESWGMADLL
jgi:hypothetical protein